MHKQVIIAICCLSVASCGSGSEPDKPLGEREEAQPSTTSSYDINDPEFQAEGERQRRAMDAQRVSDALDLPADQKKRAYDAQYRLTGTLKAFERIDSMLGMVDGQAQVAVECGLRSPQWRLTLVGRIKSQWARDPIYQQLWNSLEPAEQLAAMGMREDARRLSLSPNWRPSCDGLERMPYLRMFDLVSAGVMPYKGAAPDPNDPY